MSLSVSPVTEAVLGSLPLTDGERTAVTVADVQRLFNRYGATEIFVRVDTLGRARVRDAEYGMDRALERARLAPDLGMPLNPELGLWAVYGDITHQPGPDFSDFPSIRLPGPWSSLTLAQMERALRHYGALAARRILATGVRVNYWDLGNEVDWGVAGVAVRGFDPTGYQPPDAVDPAIGQITAVQLLRMPQADRIGWLRRHLWPYVGRLLAATADGVRCVDSGARFSSHLANIGVEDATAPAAFWSAIQAAGYRPALFGTSLYPTNGDPGDRRKVFLDIARELRQRFGRRSFFAEFGYPSGPMAPPFAWNNEQAGYPQTADGQFRYLRDLVSQSVQTGAVAGIRPWGPDYCTSVRSGPRVASSVETPSSGGWAPMSLFDVTGVAKPALAAVTTGLGAAVRRNAAGTANGTVNGTVEGTQAGPDRSGPPAPEFGEHVQRLLPGVVDAVGLGGDEGERVAVVRTRSLGGGEQSGVGRDPLAATPAWIGMAERDAHCAAGRARDRITMSATGAVAR